MLSRSAHRLASFSASASRQATVGSALARSLCTVLPGRWAGSALATTRSTSPLSSSRLRFNPSLFARSLASAATSARQVELEEEEDFDATPTEDSEPPASTAVPFQSLKGSVSHDTLKALTVRPFKFTEMSVVQERVLGLMPELIGVKKRTGEAEVEGEEKMDTNKVGEKQDLLVKAKTGTGKTVAFLVPGIEARKHRIEKEIIFKEDGERYTPHERGRVQRAYSRSSAGTLVISPTRELATQIAAEATKLMTHHKEYEVQLLVGGESRRNQLRNWSRGRLDVVVATPGRLRDLLEDSTADGDMVREGLAATQLLVLDEADTLLDMGFSADLNFIIGKLPKARQTFLFSATVSPAIRDIAKKSLDRNHGVIDCVPANESNTHMHIPQFATVLPTAKDQLPHVLRLLAHDQLTNPGASKAIVFLPTTKLTQLYATFIRELSNSLPMGRRTHVYEIHSKLDQRRRSRSSEMFRQDHSGASILVTSDVSARGVDYPGVTRVIQVNIPGTAEQYIHRVGRTGRGGSLTGRGDLVLLPWEAQWMKELRKVPIQETSLEKIAEDVETMAAEFDEDPVAYAQARGLAPIKEANDSRKPTRGAFLAKKSAPASIPAFAPRNTIMPQAVEDLVSTLDPEAVNEVFSSSLGYYVSKVDALGMSSMSVVKALQNWAVEAGGLPEAPYVSASFLAKLGVRSDRAPARGNKSGSFGKRTGSSFSRDRTDRGSSYGGERSAYGGGGERSAYGGGERSSYGGGEKNSFGSGSSGRSSFGDRSSGRSSYGGASPRRGSDRY